jgi:hypothetical protein
MEKKDVHVDIVLDIASVIRHANYYVKSFTRRGRGSINCHRAPRPPLAPAHEDAGTQHLVGLRRGGLVPVLILAVGADAVAKLHAQRAVSERS